MKKINKLMTLALAFFMALSLFFMSGVTVQAKNSKPYTYTVHFLAAGDAIFTGSDGIYINAQAPGNRVDISSDKKIMTISGLNYADLITFSVHEFIGLDQGSIYNIAGLKEAGTEKEAEAKINVKKDIDYVTIYSLEKLVEYTVSYVDEAGKELMPSQTLSGPIGAKIAVPYKYIDGYIPDAYTKTRTLSEDPAKNTIVFNYKEGYISVDGGRTYEYGKDTYHEETVYTGVDNRNSDNQNATASNTSRQNTRNNDGNANRNANRAGRNQADNNADGNANAADGVGNQNDGANTNRQNRNQGNVRNNDTTIDEPETPTAPEDVVDIDDEQVAKGVFDLSDKMIYIVAFVIVLIAIAVMVFAIAQRKKLANASDVNKVNKEDK